MLTHPNIRLRPLELLALNQITELLPRILEQSLLDLRNDKTIWLTLSLIKTKRFTLNLKRNYPLWSEPLRRALSRRVRTNQNTY
jgi:hypothetical protein